MALKVGELYALLGMDTGRFDKALGRVKAAGASVDDVEVEIITDESDALQGARRVEVALDGIEDETVNVDVDTGTARAKLAGLDRNLKDTKRSSDDTGRSASDLAKNFEKLAGGAGIAATATKLLKFPVMVQGITAAIGGVAALTGGVVALTSALGPLVGLLPAAGAGATAFGQALGVTKLALSNVGDGLKDAWAAAEEFGAGSAEAKAAVEGMSPAAAALVTHLVALQEPFFRLRDATQEAMFPGFVSALHTLEPLLGRFRPALVLTASAIGDLAARGAALVASPAFSGQLESLMRQNVGTITGLGNASLTLAPALLSIVMASAPLVERFTALTQRSAETFARFIEGKNASGELAAFFTETGNVAGTLGSVLGSLLTIIGNVGRAGYDMGRGLWVSLDGALERVAKLTGSFSGQNAMSDFFESLRPTLDAIGSLLGAVADGFGKLFVGLGPSLAPVIAQIEGKLLPVLLDLFGKMDGEFLTSLVDLAASFVEFANVFLTATPALTAMVDAFAWLMDTAVGVKEALGPVGDILVNMLAVLSAAGLVSGILSIASAISGLIGPVAGLGLLAKAIGAVSAALTFLAANPVVLVIMAIVGAIALLVIHFDTLKRWAGDAIGFVIAKFVEFKNWAGDKIAGVIGFIVNLWNKFGEMRDKISGVIADVIGFFARLVVGAKEKLGEVVDWVQGIPNAIWNVFSGAGEWLVDAGKRIISGLIVGMAKMYVALRRELANVTSWIPQWKGPPGVDAKLLYGTGQLIIGGLEAGMVDQFGSLKSTLGGMTNDIAVPVAAGVGRAGVGGGGPVFMPGSIVVQGSVIAERDLATTIENVVDGRNYRRGSD